MTEDLYLSILAKIMREQVNRFDEMNTLYHIIDEELYECLEQLEFPSVPELSERLDRMLQYVNSLLLCPSVIGKNVIAIYRHHTNKLFREIKNEIRVKDISWLTKQNTQIPILVLNSEEIEIEVVSTSFSKIALSIDEFELLLAKSTTNRVAINNLIKFFIIKLPLNSADRCYLLDNTYKHLTDLFEVIINLRIYKVSIEDIDFIKPWYFKSMDYILCDEKCERNLLECNLIDHHTTAQILYDLNCMDLLENKSAIVSFFDIFKYSVSPLTDYYNRKIIGLTDILKELTDDLIRDESDVLVGFYDDLKVKLKQYQESKESVDLILLKLEKVVESIDEQYQDVTSDSGSIMTVFLKDCIFSYYFTVAGIDMPEEKKCIERLFEHGYEHRDLLLNYSKSINGSSSWTLKKQFFKGSDWECAKMVVHFTKNESINDEIKDMMHCIGKDRLSTGKEWYYWSLIYNDSNALKRAVQLGCDMACKKLYNDSQSYFDRKLLSSMLYPDACIDRGLQDVLTGNKVYSIYDKRLAYLKIAAAVGDFRGIELIAEILYENVIWGYFSHKGKPLKDNYNIEIYLIVLELCEYLVAHKIQTMKNKERVAVINFCLDRNMSAVHSTFYNMGTDSAYYCKGYLAEYGLYNCKDLDKALRLYERVKESEIPAVSNAKKRVKSKITTRERNKNEEYHQDKDYSGYSSSNVVKSDGCFITTAASCALNKGRDCNELNFLRKFRDEHISSSPEGKALVAEYYNIAPKIIKKIDLEDNASTIYADLWGDYIIPSVKEIQKGNLQNAQDIYVAMVVDLSMKYKVEINTVGYEELYHSTLKRIGYK